MKTFNFSSSCSQVACSTNNNLLLIDSNNRFIHDDKTHSITPLQSVHFTLPSRNTPGKKDSDKISSLRSKSFHMKIKFIILNNL